MRRTEVRLPRGQEAVVELRPVPGHGGLGQDLLLGRVDLGSENKKKTKHNHRESDNHFTKKLKLKRPRLPQKHFVHRAYLILSSKKQNNNVLLVEKNVILINNFI